MPLLNKICNMSYGNVRENSKVVSDHGWYPANRKLELHPSLIQELLSNRALRVIDGGGTVIDTFTTHRMRLDGVKEAVEKRKRDREDIPEKIKVIKRLTAGDLVGNELHSPDHPNFLNPFREQQQ